MRKRTIAVGICVFLSFIISSFGGLFAQKARLRPIPSLQITLQTVNGKPMDANQVKAYQNPGY